MRRRLSARVLLDAQLNSYRETHRRVPINFRQNIGSLIGLVFPNREPKFSRRFCELELKLLRSLRSLRNKGNNLTLKASRLCIKDDNNNKYKKEVDNKLEV